MALRGTDSESYITEYTRPGGNRGTKGWCLQSASMQMLPRRGSICGDDLRFAQNSTPGWFSVRRKKPSVCVGNAPIVSEKSALEFQVSGFAFRASYFVF